MDNSDLPAGDWQEEEVIVPQLKFEMEFDQYGHPTKSVPKIVEEKLKRRYTYAKLLPHQICPPGEHYFEIQNGGKRVAGRVEVQCRSCTYGQAYTVGYHQLVDGKIITRVNDTNSTV